MTSAYNVTSNVTATHYTPPHFVTEEEVHEAEMQLKVAFAMSVSFLVG